MCANRSRYCPFARQTAATLAESYLCRFCGQLPINMGLCRIAFYILFETSSRSHTNANKASFPRTRNVPSPPAAGRTPSASCLGGRSLILRSLRPAASGSANIIHVIVSCCALLALVPVPGLCSVAAVCLVRYLRVGRLSPGCRHAGIFFITRPGSSPGMADAFGTLPAEHESRQFDPLCVRDEPAAAPFSCFKYPSPVMDLIRPEPPPTLYW